MEIYLGLKSEQLKSAETSRNNNNEIIISMQSINNASECFVNEQAISIVCLKIQRMEFFIS